MNKFVKKASIVAIAAIIAVTVVAPAQTQAEVTIETLQAQISDLLVTINALTAQIAVLTGGTTGGTTPGGTTGFTFDRSLTVGSEGNDVKELQMLLNSNAATQVAASGVGSAGNETIYFGPLTRAAVIKFQDLYASEVLTPLGLSAGTGFFGSSSRAKANTLTVGGGGGTTPPVSTTPGVVNVTVTGPASSTFVTNQGTATLANFVFTGSGTVTALSVKRIGVSADASLSSVFLFNGDQRLTDGASVSSGSIANFTDPNGIFTVNGVTTISVRANLAASAGETMGIQLTGVTLSNGTVGGVPATGNLHTVATATLAAVAIGTSTASGSSDPGNDIVVWQDVFTISTRDVTMTRLALRQIGSINTEDIENFRLLIDGIEVAQAQSLDSNRYVTFGFNRLLTSGAKTIKVVADVIGGSGRTVQMSLRGSYDATIIDSQYGGNVVITGTLPNSPTAFTVNAGTMTVVKATDSPSTDIILAGTDISLARYTFTAYGEPVKVETLLVDFTYTDNGGGNSGGATLRNGRILVNGSQVGSTTTLNPASTGTSFTTNFVVSPGSPATVEVRSDVFDNDSTDDIDATDTILAILSTGSANAIPQESLTPIAVPGSNINANTLTVASGTLSLTADTNYTNRNVIAPQTAYKLADFDLSNTNVEVVNVNTLTLTDTGTTDTFELADLTNVYIKYGSSTTQIKSTVTSGQAFSVTFTMAKNESMPIEIYGNVLSGNVTATDDMILNLAVTATTGSGQSANLGAQAGQTLSVQTSGSITISLNSGSSPVAQIVSDNQTIDAAVYNFATVTDSYTITAATVTLGNATAVKNVILKNGSTVLATKPAATSVTFSGLNVLVPEDNIETDLTIVLELGGVGVGAGTTGSSIQVSMPTVTARSTATGTSAVVSGVASVSAGNANYVYAAIPSMSRVALPTTLLSTGTVTLAKFTIDADGGTIGWKELYFTVTKTSGIGEVTLTNATIWDGNTEVAGTDTIATLGDTDASGTISFDANNEQQIVGSKTYTLKATSTSTALSTGDNVNTTMDANLTYQSPTAQGSVGATATIVWSDRSAASHGTGTSDWNNDSQIDFLPLDSWTLVR